MRTSAQGNLNEANLFFSANARDLSRDQLVSTFVATPQFWELLTARNQMLLGCRGSGKTALMKMLDIGYLKGLKHSRAIRVVKEKRYVGIYIATSVDWVASVNSGCQHLSAPDQKRHFSWMLNLAAAAAFLRALRDCLDLYVPSKLDRVLAEEALARELSATWTRGRVDTDTLSQLARELLRLQARALGDIEAQRLPGVKATGDSLEATAYFATSPFTPLKYGIQLATEVLGLPSKTRWLLCVDEAEFLTPEQSSILNTCLRSDAGNLSFKVATLPYVNDSLGTEVSRPLDVGHDFDYVYVDRGRASITSSNEYSGFAQSLFDKLMKASSPASGSRITLGDLLDSELEGESPLLHPGLACVGGGVLDKEAILRYIEANGTRLLVDRAQRKYFEEIDGVQGPHFMDQIGRKVSGAIVLRMGVKSRKGRAEHGLYSGSSIVLRCSDGNPRRLIQIILLLLQKAGWKHGGTPASPHPLSAADQNRVLRDHARALLSHTESERQVGDKLHSFVDEIGRHMSHRLHRELLTTDQLSAVEVTHRTSDGEWEMVRAAVQRGLLYPSVQSSSPNDMPQRHGEFQLAYALAPYYDILPRRGRAIALSTIREKRSSRGRGR